MTDSALSTLDRLPAGSRAVTKSLKNGKSSASRLASMGLSVGCELEVLQNAGTGPLLVLVRNTRIGLGREEAAKVLVEEIGLEPQPRRN